MTKKINAEALRGVLFLTCRILGGIYKVIILYFTTECLNTTTLGDRDALDTTEVLE